MFIRLKLKKRIRSIGELKIGNNYLFKQIKPMPFCAIGKLKDIKPNNMIVFDGYNLLDGERRMSGVFFKLTRVYEFKQM